MDYGDKLAQDLPKANILLSQPVNFFLPFFFLLAMQLTQVLHVTWQCNEICGSFLGRHGGIGTFHFEELQELEHILYIQI